jgi:hypothetical protein
VSRAAQERDEDKRDAYQAFVGANFRAEQLVFVDESGVNRIATKRTSAWAHTGTRARRRDYFVRGKRYVSTPIPYIVSVNTDQYQIFHSAGHVP